MTAIPPTVRKRKCSNPVCPVVFETPHGGPQPAGYCSTACHRDHKRAISQATAKRVPLVNRPPRGRRRPVSPASPEQRAALTDARSIVSGAESGLTPAHLCARAQGGCDDPLCTVPLTWAEHHSFDHGELDLLPHLVRAGRVAEIAHALEHYRGDLPALLCRLTGTRWAPIGERKAAAA